MKHLAAPPMRRAHRGHARRHGAVKLACRRVKPQGFQLMTALKRIRETELTSG